MKFIVIAVTYGDFEIQQQTPIAASSNESLAKSYCDELRAKSTKDEHGYAFTTYHVTKVKDLD